MFLLIGYESWCLTALAAQLECAAEHGAEAASVIIQSLSSPAPAPAVIAAAASLKARGFSTGAEWNGSHCFMRFDARLQPYSPTIGLPASIFPESASTSML